MLVRFVQVQWAFRRWDKTVHVFQSENENPGYVPQWMRLFEWDQGDHMKQFMHENLARE